MSDQARILPQQLIFEVEQYVHGELSDAQKYENRVPFDQSGVWSLHKLAASIYAAGWSDGEQAEAERQRGERARVKDFGGDRV